MSNLLPTNDTLNADISAPTWFHYKSFRQHNHGGQGFHPYNFGHGRGPARWAVNYSAQFIVYAGIVWCIVLTVHRYSDVMTWLNYGRTEPQQVTPTGIGIGHKWPYLTLSSKDVIRTSFPFIYFEHSSLHQIMASGHVWWQNQIFHQILRPNTMSDIWKQIILMDLMINPQHHIWKLVGTSVGKSLAQSITPSDFNSRLHLMAKPDFPSNSTSEYTI